METTEFNAHEFFERLTRGEFDGHLQDELDKLSDPQIEQVALLLANKMREAHSGGQ